MEKIDQRIKAAGAEEIGVDGAAILARVRAADSEADLSAADRGAWLGIDARREAAEMSAALAELDNAPELAEMRELAAVVEREFAARQIVLRGAAAAVEFCRGVAEQARAAAAAEARARNAVAAMLAAKEEMKDWRKEGTARKKFVAAQRAAIEAGVLRAENGYVYNPGSRPQHPYAAELWKVLGFKEADYRDYNPEAAAQPVWSADGLYLHDD